MNIASTYNWRNFLTSPVCLVEVHQFTVNLQLLAHNIVFFMFISSKPQKLEAFQLYPWLSKESKKRTLSL